MAVELVFAIDLAPGGNLAQFKPVGWSGPEAWFRWALGMESRLRLPNARAGHDYIVELETGPVTVPPGAQFQRLRVRVNNRVIGEASVVHAKSRLGCLLPAELLTDEPEVEVAFEHPDAVRPSEVGLNGDRRVLSVAYSSIRIYSVTPATKTCLLEPVLERVSAGASDDGPRDRLERISEHVSAMTGLTLPELMSGFESLGQNCEFGLAQRAAGVDQFGLLRFSSIMLKDLISGLADRFARIDDAEGLRIKAVGPPPKEYMVHQDRYALLYHTFIHENQLSAEEMVPRQLQYLRFLRDKLLEDLRQGTKILVVTRHKPLRLEDVLPLYMKLCELGANTLLWVVPHDALHPPGMVERVADGLLKGYIDRFAPPENAYNLSLEVWVQICINAYRLKSIAPQPPEGPPEQHQEPLG